MDQLAVELLIDIFTLACTDGGQATTRSLSLVCKQFNAVARPLRFHSIRLGPDALRITPLLAALEQEHALHGPTHAPKVRHIRLLGMGLLWKNLSIPGRYTVRDPRLIDVWFAQLSSILRIAAPHLETLVVSGCYLARLAPAVEFPALRELYCVAGPEHFSSVVKDVGGARLYPVLERLHHVQGKSGLDVEGWVHHAPNVTHLYVSQIAENTDADILAQFNGARPWTPRSLEALHGLANMEQCDGAHHSPTDAESSTKLPFPHLKVLVMKAAGYRAPPHWIHRVTWRWTTQRHRTVFEYMWRVHDHAVVPTYIIPSVGPWTEEDTNCTGGAGSQWTIDERLLRAKYPGETIPDFLQGALVDPPPFYNRNTRPSPWMPSPRYHGRGLFFSLPRDEPRSYSDERDYYAPLRQFLKSRLMEV